MRTCKLESCSNEVTGCHRTKFCSKECSKAYEKDYQKEYQKEYQKTDKYRDYQKEYQKTDKRKAYQKEYQKEWRDDNKAYHKSDKRKAYYKEYQRSDKYKTNRREYRRDRYHSDPLFRLTATIRSLTLSAFKNKGYKKNSKTENILGCSFEELKSYIESQFKDGMSWENQGEWHIDHIVPISWADSEFQVYGLSYYQNLQPLWAEENISKGNRFIG